MDRNEIDEKAIRLARNIQENEIELLETLQLVEQLRIFEDFKLRSLFEYCLDRLDLSSARAYTFMKVAEIGLRFPALHQAIASHRLHITNAVTVARILDEENQEFWIYRASVLSNRALAREIAKTKPGAHINDRVRPIAQDLFELRCSLSEEGVNLLERAMDLLGEQKRGVVLERVLAQFVKQNDPIKKAERAQARHAKQTAQTAPTEPKAEAEAESLAAPPMTPPTYQNGKRTATPRPLVNSVHQKNDGRCAFLDSFGRRCFERRHLKVHHVIEVCHGGLHEEKNLDLFCSYHHGLIHRTAPA